MVFAANNKIGKLSKLKCKLPLIKQSQLIYQINCDDCQDFYIGMTNRRLETRLKEHRTNENSALFKHSFLTDHNINFSNPKILAKDSSSFRLVRHVTSHVMLNFLAVFFMCTSDINGEESFYLSSHSFEIW